MRKTSLSRTFDDFDESLAFYTELAVKVVNAKRVIRYKYEKTELLEAFVLRLVALWEVFVADLLAACLNRDSSQYAQYRGLTLRKHLSADECYAMLTGLGYLDFHRVGDVKGTARRVLVLNPFDAIPTAAARKIDELTVMRNYLAHYSGRSKRALDALYRGTYHMQRFREPGDFLWVTTRPGQIRFGTYLGALFDASSAMRLALGQLAE